MKKYFEEPAGVIYHGDCLGILPHIGADEVDVVITDPVWPDYKVELIGRSDPYGLFLNAASHFPRLCDRVVVILGCDVDPRILFGIPDEMKFVRVCWMHRIPPMNKGPILYSAEVAYVFGAAWLPGDGSRLLAGECCHPFNRHANFQSIHPCPRHFRDMLWLVQRYSKPGHVVIDPFGGVGTIPRAAKAAGRRYIMIEIEERYCEEAAEKLLKTEWNRNIQEVLDYDR